MNLKGLPSEERPRERFIKYGRDNISNEELIEIILKSGTRKYGLKEISHNILSSVNNINELKNILSKKEIDNKEYASAVSKLFIIDFYTLSNKTSINDVGSVQFVYSSYKSDFIDYAREGIYKQVKSNLDNDRSQDLPEVKSVTINSIEEIVPSTELKSDDFKNVTDPEAYKVKISWDYTRSNDFQTSATMVIVKDGEKLSVAKLEDE